MSKLLFLLAFILMLLPVPEVYAAQPNVGTLLANLAKAMPNLMKLVTAFSYVAGMYMVYKGIMELKKFGEQRTMMSHQHELKGPLIYLFVGAALLYFPTTVNVGISTFWNYSSPLSYISDEGDAWQDTISAALLVIQLIGAIAFIRGLLMLTQMAGQGGHSNVFGKAMAHIIGGIFCINMYGFVKIIINTLALGQI